MRMNIRTDLRRSWLSRPRLAVAGTLCGVGLGNLKLIAGSEMARPLMNAPRLKRWNARSASCATYSDGVDAPYGIEMCQGSVMMTATRRRPWTKFCLLYTSDAADDLLCVDLGGRRI